MESVELRPSEFAAPAIERVVLDKESTEIINSHLQELRREIGDAVNVTAKHVVNFLIQKRSTPFSYDERKEFTERFTDSFKLLKAIMTRANLAKKEGREYPPEFQKILDTLGVNGNQPAKRRRKRASAKDESPGADSDQIGLPSPLETSEMPPGGGVEPQSPNTKKSKSLRKSTQEFDLENS